MIARSTRITRHRATAAALAATCLTATLAACGSSGAPAKTAAASFPGTAAGRQAGWLFGAVTHAPIPVPAIDAHFDQAFLAQVPASKLNSVFASVGGLRLDSITRSTASALLFTVTTDSSSRLSVSIETDSHGLISGLLLSPVSKQPTPTSWSGVDGMIRSVSPQAKLLVAQVTNGTCTPVHGIDATTPAPLGSAFKLYVLDALARAIAAGRVRWNQQLTVTSQLKSLPSGVLQNDPDGTKVTVQKAATGMISISDNTAANMLLNLVGRSAVEAATRDTGMADPALDVPFLTTRELFVLKLDDWPALADRYLAASPAGRQALLTSTIDKVPLSALDARAWTQPRDIGSLEWFASPADMCRVFASLASLARQPGLAPLAGILSDNPGGLTLDPSQWQPPWFKGGSEPGVLTLNYLATTRTGHTYVVSVLIADPSAPLDETSVTPKLISAVTGALQLAAG